MSGVSASLETTRGSLATIGRLEAVGRNIEKIVNAISLVVVQTSMLAVSGAVEAARAGEAGPRLRGGVERHSRPRARGLGERRQDQGDRRRHPRADRLAAARPRADRRFRRGRGPEQPHGARRLREGEPRDRGAARAPTQRSCRAPSRSWRPPPNRRPARARSPAPRRRRVPPPGRRRPRRPNRRSGAEDLAAAIEEIASLADDAQAAEWLSAS